MTSLDFLPLPMTRRRVLGLGLAAALATRIGALHDAVAQGATTYTFVVAGLDTRTADQPENTDVLMVSRVNLEAGTVRTISLPRDLLVEIPGFAVDKIGRAYDYGIKADPDGNWVAGVESTEATIAYNFGIEIDGAAITNFQGYPAVVDALGGVEVTNPYDLYDGEYPTADFGTTEIFFPAGAITLNGDEALQFSRTRHQDGDDGRVMRQQLVLTAILEKIQEPAIVADLPELIAALSDAVRTNIPLEVQMDLIAAVPGISVENVVFGTITDQLWGDTTDSGMWVYQGDWSTLPGYVQSFLAG